jgi:hypothetical protein
MGYTTSELYRLYDPNTTLTDDNIDYYIDSVSAALDSYLDRTMESTLYQELHTSFDDNIIIANQWPITKIHEVMYAPQYYGSITITNADNGMFNMDIIKTWLNGTVSRVDITINNAGTDELFTFTTTDTMQTVFDDIATYMGTVSDSAVVSIGANEASASFAAIWDGDVTIQWQGSTNSSFIIELGGNQLGAMPRYTLEAERNVYVSSRSIGHTVNSMNLVYTAGYEMPSGTSYGTLPRELVDVANAMVQVLGDAVTNALPAGVTEIKLGDATAKMKGTALQAQTAMGLVDNFSDTLTRYRRKDIMFF